MGPDYLQRAEVKCLWRTWSGDYWLLEKLSSARGVHFPPKRADRIDRLGRGSVGRVSAKFVQGLA